MKNTLKQCVRKLTAWAWQHEISITECGENVTAIFESLKKERDAAHIRAGKAEYEMEDLRDTKLRRDQWLDQAKREWGVSTNISFDKVWEQAIKIRAERDAAQADRLLLILHLEECAGNCCECDACTRAASEAKAALEKIKR